jgi:hypothetical protein
VESNRMTEPTTPTSRLGQEALETNEILDERT